MNSGWSYVAGVLAEAGCELVAGLPADEPGLLDAAAEEPLLRAVVTRDERVAASLATGHALLAGRPAVVALSTGPAFTSAIGALTEAAAMCVPLVVLTTRVAGGERGRGAFQEVDQQGLAATFAKWWASVEHPGQLRWALRRGVAQALGGRPGVSVIELAPQSLVGAPAPDAQSRSARGEAIERARTAPVSRELDRAAALLAGARAPVVVFGGGARGDEAREPIARLADCFAAAYCTTASGRGSIAEDHPLACGSVGLYATRPLDSLLEEADMVLAVGTQLEETARIGWPRLRTAELVHVDCDPEVLGRALEPTLGLVGDAGATCAELAERLAARRHTSKRAGWRARVLQARERALALTRRVSFETLPACATLRALSGAFPEAVLVQENGLEDLWGYSYPAAYLGSGHTFLVPGEQTAMGFGIGAAVGAALAAPDRPVLATCGDGALGMSLAALPSAAECGGQLLIVMWDNHGFGWSRLARAGTANHSLLTDFQSTPPAVQAVRAAGGVAILVSSQAELDAGVSSAGEALADGRLALLSVAIDGDALPPAARKARNAAAG